MKIHTFRKTERINRETKKTIPQVRFNLKNFFMFGTQIGMLHFQYDNVIPYIVKKYMQYLFV